ncbi:unnamed protein product [Candidatus Paraburkholderia kirkii UZHbot1]|uniref:WGS project CAFE00000000 data, contig bkir_c122 n=1 Tax=Candidatus Paraburkholderia kirkii UZHbot1 TaxID=1055526 RepID=U3UAI8_9BURK|nr:unnamed protein product [Candidatus Paraburkholderia kirkii UZHbot1]
MNRLHLRTLGMSWPIRVLLAVALGLIIYAYFHGRGQDAPPEPAATSTSKSAAGASVAAGASGAPAASASDAGASDTATTTERPPIDLFPSQNWQPPPLPPPPPDTVRRPPPLPPEPPPLPCTVRSLWLDEHGVFYIVIAGAGREFPLCVNYQKKGFLRRGDVILNAYRIDEIGKDVRFTYLPLKRHQTLPLGELK